VDGILQTTLKTLAHRLDQRAMALDELGNGREQRIELHTLIEELRIGKTPLRIQAPGQARAIRRAQLATTARLRMARESRRGGKFSDGIEVKMETRVRPKNQPSRVAA
jgi:hypothetical protein